MIEYFIFDKGNSEYLVKSDDDFYRVVFDEDMGEIGVLRETTHRAVIESEPTEPPKEFKEALKEQEPQLF